MNHFDQRRPAVLALSTGDYFLGRSCGDAGQVMAELVFNTSMTGYQEIMTDPSYKGQIVVFTSAHIGGVGTNIWDNESDRVHLSGLVVRDLVDTPSNWQTTQSLHQFLMTHQVVGIQSVDTRALTVLLRRRGSQYGCIDVADDAHQPSGIARARALAQSAIDDSMTDFMLDVTSAAPICWNDHPFCAHKATTSIRCTVVVIDCGVKRSILNALAFFGCRVFVLPIGSTQDDILMHRPDGVVLSNGPGNPAVCTALIALTQSLMARKMPILGICLGHQILALAQGLAITKMSFGHHGANHPVQDLSTRQVFITSQNHCYAVDESSLDACAGCVVTHRSLFDQSIQGLRYQSFPGLSFQGHPEGGGGPQDMYPIFERFISLMTVFQEGGYAAPN